MNIGCLIRLPINRLHIISVLDKLCVHVYVVINFIVYEMSLSIVRRELPRWLSGKESACNSGDTKDKGLIPGLGRAPGVENGSTHSSILAWENPWTEKPDRLQSMGLQKSQTGLSN